MTTPAGTGARPYLYLRKNRRGKRGKIRLLWRGKIQRFENWTE